jgi:DNA helicase II / ATP-dependent DNA helicase PcrA
MNTYQHNFQEGINKLNLNQKKAVDTIDGSVMVIAGPGSGKTQILSLRIANILAQTDAIASSILCLTFTDNASYNMRKRLTKFLGPDSSKVNVFTFHSFAKYIMEQFPEYFWMGSYMKPLDPINKVLILEEILGELSSSNSLTSKGLQDEYVFLKSISTNIAEIKKFGLSSEQFESVVLENKKYIDEFGDRIEELLSVASYPKNLEIILSNLNEILAFGDNIVSSIDQNLFSLKGVLDERIRQVILDLNNNPKSKSYSELKDSILEKKLLKERKITKKNLDLATIYDLYQSKIRKAGFYDYEDMILETVSELKQNDELRLILQERYQYVLVDEFQDTNLAQMELVDGLLNMELTENNPNLFVVGDEDQCIYKFQGAEIENLIGFKRKFSKVEVITMTQNYRSNQAILDYAGLVIESSSSRLSNSPEFSFVDKKLVSMVVGE